MNHIMKLEEIVEQAFVNATERPSLLRWRQVSIVAGCAAVRMAADGKHFMAAQLEGVAEEARRQMLKMMPEEIAA